MQIPGLLNRMTALADLAMDEENGSRSSVETVDAVMDRLWLYTQTYTVNKDDLALEEKLSVWYVMDEFGSRIRHNNEPKFRIIPFYYVPQNILYSILFPIADSQYGDEVTRDFVEGAMPPNWPKKP
uniref:Tubulin--tyrosine ligase-like protein 12 SET-like domain-containing protein n=1 Tax=Romanomermis culicivorax TaxID=13658 RepID=A0A915KZP0_ROMCU